MPSKQFAIFEATVEAVAQWFDGRESLYREGGPIGPRAFMTGDPRSDLPDSRHSRCSGDPCDFRNPPDWRRLCAR